MFDDENKHTDVATFKRRAEWAEARVKKLEGAIGRALALLNGTKNGETRARDQLIATLATDGPGGKP